MSKELLCIHRYINDVGKTITEVTTNFIQVVWVGTSPIHGFDKQNNTMKLAFFPPVFLVYI